MSTEGKTGEGSTHLSLISYGTPRPDAPVGAPDFEQLLPAFRTFVDSMRVAAHVFENDDDVEGCKMALHAVARLLGRRHLPFFLVGFRSDTRSLPRLAARRRP